MNSIFLNNLLLFAAGATVGSVVTWKLLKTKYEQIAQEEIDSVKERFSNKHKEEVEEKIDEKSVYNELVNESGYNTVSDDFKKEEVDDVETPYIIEIDEFAELDDYETNTLYYYADGVLTDEYGNLMDEDDVDDIVGREALEYLDDVDDDSVYVRNDRLKSDYEILRDERRYSDAYPTEA